jgi:hypothetical protein
VNEKGTEAERGPVEAESFFNKAPGRGNHFALFEYIPLNGGAFCQSFRGAFLAATQAPAKATISTEHSVRHILIHDQHVYGGLAVLHNVVNLLPPSLPKTWYDFGVKVRVRYIAVGCTEGEAKDTK